MANLIIEVGFQESEQWMKAGFRKQCSNHSAMALLLKYKLTKGALDSPIQRYTRLKDTR